MFLVEALAMGRPVLYMAAADERGARKRAEALRVTFQPHDGREIIVRGPQAPLAWWTARASTWQLFGS